MWMSVPTSFIAETTYWGPRSSFVALMDSFRREVPSRLLLWSVGAGAQPRLADSALYLLVLSFEEMILLMRRVSSARAKPMPAERQVRSVRRNIIASMSVAH